jgi:HEPN domain-containing protein
MNRRDLQKLAELRLEEAKTLYDNGFYDGAVYLCGYVIEAALKARICKHLQMKEYLDTGDMKSMFLSHDFDRLLFLSGLKNRINLANRRGTKLFQNWSLLTNWTPDIRYAPVGTHNRQHAKDLIEALIHNSDGFLVWIKKLW